MLRFASRPTLPGWLWTATCRLVIPLVFLFAGCGDTCFVFDSNSSSGSINAGFGNSASACRFPKIQGRIQVSVRLARTCQGCSESNQIDRVWVTLNGVDLHRTGSGQGLHNWEELNLFEQQPFQVDLTKGNGNGSVPLGNRAALLVGSYDMVRLRFKADQRGTGLPNEEPDLCGAAGPNCVVMRDGRTVSLLLQGTSPEVVIGQESLASGPFFLLPEADNELLIELVPVWYGVVSPGGGVRFFPVLTGTANLDRRE